MSQSILPQTSKSTLENPSVDEKETMLLSRPTSLTRRWILAAFLVIYALWTIIPQKSLFGYGFHCKTKEAASWTPSTIDDGKPLVPFEAHIMSKCPDAQDCLRMMVLPTMQRVFDKVNFTLSFIGTPTDNDGVSCKHGPDECMGNIIELCAAHVYPDPKTYLGFTMCLTRDYADIPDESLVKDCALEHAVDFNKLNECASKDDVGFGMAMLRDSVRRSTDAGVTKSCTVRLNNEIYCVRDGGKWSDCPKGAGVNDLVLEIEKIYRGSS